MTIDGLARHVRSTTTVQSKMIIQYPSINQEPHIHTIDKLMTNTAQHVPRVSHTNAALVAACSALPLAAQHPCNQSAAVTSQCGVESNNSATIATSSTLIKDCGVKDKTFDDLRDRVNANHTHDQMQVHASHE